MSTCERDIVARLRAVLHEDRSVELMNREAADEIERLRAELADAWRKSSQALVELSSNLCATSARERERIVAERDEARREVCKRVESASCLSDGEPTTIASDYARWCGWDCFKENTDGYD